MKKYGFWTISSIFLGLSSIALAEEKPFDLPVNCEIGKNCFLQNLIDLDQEGPNVVDSLCGQDGYNGHKGIDIRVLTTGELAKGVPIYAIKEGTIKGVRNNMEDRLVEGNQKPASIQGRECGNGLVLDHGDGLTSQYCHMKKGSVLFKPGDKVARGAVLGQMGLSGWTAFPHIHLTVRQNGKLIDPLSKKSAEPLLCSASIPEQSLFSQDVTKALFESRDDIVSIGLTDRAVDFGHLKKVDTMPVPTLNSTALVAWGWVLNAKAGDIMRLVIQKGDGVLLDHKTKPLERRKAQQFNFAGKRLSVEEGAYSVTVQMLREGHVVEQKTSVYTVK